MSEKLQFYIMTLLRYKPSGLTRKDIIKGIHSRFLIRFKRTTVYDNLKKLEVAKLVYSERCHEGKIGAPKTVWKLII